MSAAPLRIIPATGVRRSDSGATLDQRTLDGARAIIDRVRAGGDEALREYAEKFKERAPGQPLAVGRDEMNGALERINADDRAVLERTAERIRSFALAQRDALRDMETGIPGGRAGHSVVPIERAGCYAPGGRYPLPSSVLMTAVTARVAGCARVVVASPNPNDITLAAAAIADADELLCLGGAHAIAALAYSTESIDGVDVIVGPGNRWVTAAKKLVSGDVAIDMLAGPSELVVLADESADDSTVAADLLAQAEHDEDARPILVTTSDDLARRVNGEIARQLAHLPTAETARRALNNGFAAIARSMDGAIGAVDALAPEHLEVICRDAGAIASRIAHAGAIFIGERSAEVFGDYGFGPNHSLPTGGAARTTGGLSVVNFLRIRTWMRIDDPGVSRRAMADAERLAELEGLAGHAAACRVRAATARQ